jgi:Flp pilus assembly protein TadB
VSRPRGSSPLSPGALDWLRSNQATIESASSRRVSARCTPAYAILCLMALLASIVTDWITAVATAVLAAVGLARFLASRDIKKRFSNKSVMEMVVWTPNTAPRGV